jgi:hypothetical protein
MRVADVGHAASAIVWLDTQRRAKAGGFFENRIYKWNLTFLAAGLFTTATSTGKSDSCYIILVDNCPQPWLGGSCGKAAKRDTPLRVDSSLSS